MKKYLSENPIGYIGLFFFAFGFIGGFDILGTRIAWLNTISKDQISVLFGITWFYISIK